MALATARAGNVVGGGDWAEDRLVPDLVRAIAAGQDPDAYAEVPRRRGVLLAKYGKGKKAWTLAITHLSLGVKSRQLQLGFLADLLSEESRLVLMGDFNCDFDAPEMRALYRETSLEPPPERVCTFPSWAPQRCLDHILVGGFDVLDYKAVPAAGSDHMAVGVELRPK